MELIVSADKSFLECIPVQPGVYRFYAKNFSNGHECFELLYVGKAINLYKRVSSYFYHTNSLSLRIKLMLSQIYKIELTVTPNEASALILENNLIKSLEPKYNIIFRDDKSYPLIRITRHEFPKIDSYRGKHDIISNYNVEIFGPYPNVYSVKAAIDTITKLFKLRTCSDATFANRKLPCMLYQIKRCSAPCVGYISASDYAEQVRLSLQFLRGNYGQIVATLTQEMNQYAELLNFECAAETRDRIAELNQICQKQVINNHNQPITADIVVAKAVDSRVIIYIIRLKNGVYFADMNFTLNNPDDNLVMVLSVFLQNYYLRINYVPVIYLTLHLNCEFLHMFYAATLIKIVVNPKNTHIKRLISMALFNLDKIIANNIDKEKHNDFTLAIERLSELLDIQLIKRIECIDISHNHGINTVASCVVYENGKIDSSKYRQYNLPDSIKGNDLLALETMLNRRLTSKVLLLPDVIVVDGGINQYNIVKNTLFNRGLCDKIRVVSIYKDKSRNPKYDKVILTVNLTVARSQEPILFRLLQALRDEAHRFAITKHRNKQNMVISKLEDIPNVGVKLRKSLIIHFGSLRSVSYASLEELKRVPGIGPTKALQIYNYFH